MKYCLIPILLFFSLKNLRAQHIGINLRFGAEKEFEIGKKIELEVEQQLQLSPEVTEVEDKYGSLFNEIYLFPDDDEEDNDDDDGQAEPDDPDNALNDNPIAIDANFRSATGLKATFDILPWLKIGQSYTLNLQEEWDVRHSLGTVLELEGYVVPKKFLVEWRFSFQQTSRQRESGIEWQRDLLGRLNLEYAFKKDHRLFAASSLNKEFDEGQLEWDRLRLDGGIRYRYRKLHQFTLSYRFQRELTGKERTSHGVGLGYILRF
jgi:hypothetical protein